MHMWLRILYRMQLHHLPDVNRAETCHRVNRVVLDWIAESSDLCLKPRLIRWPDFDPESKAETIVFLSEMTLTRGITLHNKKQKRIRLRKALNNSNSV